MFRKIAAIFIIINLLTSLNAQDLQLYPVKTGMISYKYEGRTSGNEIIYFDSYGELFFRLKTVLSNKNAVNDSSITILKHDTLYQIDMGKKTVIINPDTNNFYSDKHNIISSEVLSALDFVNSGIENIAGKSCNKFSGENGTLWVWNSIVLKSETEIMNTNIIKEATEISIGIDIPASRFEVPDNYKIITK